MTRSLTTLMTGLIDYAGLFPPAKLDMGPAANNYAKYLVSAEASMLGRFICPTTRLTELTEAAAILMPGTHATSGYREHADLLEPWRISAIIDGPIGDCLDVIDAFNEHHSHEDSGRAVIDAIELKTSSAHFIDDSLEAIPEDIYPCFEFPIHEDCRGFIAALAGGSAAAKVRCGGVAPDLFPKPEDLATFISACSLCDVPFKATAGLHHPVRAEYDLTYDDKPPRGVMFGFLNVFMAAALARDNQFDADGLVDVLTETDASVFAFTDDAASWRDHSVPVVSLAKTRESFALSFGSCSFEEPLADLKGLGLL